MGSGFKSRGVHHWEDSLRFVETQTGGCFVLRTHFIDCSGHKKARAPVVSNRARAFTYWVYCTTSYLAALSSSAPALLGVVENWLASSRTTALSSWRSSSGSIDADASTERSISTAWVTASLPCSVSDTT